MHESLVIYTCINQEETIQLNNTAFYGNFEAHLKN